MNALRLAKEIHERGCSIFILGQGRVEEIHRHLCAFGLDSTIPIFTVHTPKGVLQKIVKHFPNSYFWIPCLYKLWKMRNQFNILHCPLLMDSVFICALTEIFIGKPSIIKIGSAGRYGDVSRAARNKLSWLIRFFIQKITMFVCMTEEIETEIKTEFNIPENKIQRIPNGIDAENYSGMTMDDKIQFKHSLGISEGKKIVLFVGRLEKKIRVDFLIRAWSMKYREDKNSPYLLIVGDGTFREELEDLCGQLDVENTVIFYGNTNKISSIMQVSNAFVLPSVSEGLANVILEAMSSGLPIIATNTKGNAEILTHQVDALLFEENDQDDLINKILLLIENEDFAKTISTEARKKVMEQFSIQSITKQYLELYHSLNYKPL